VVCSILAIKKVISRSQWYLTTTIFFQMKGKELKLIKMNSQLWGKRKILKRMINELFSRIVIKFDIIYYINIICLKCHIFSFVLKNF